MTDDNAENMRQEIHRRVTGLIAKYGAVKGRQPEQTGMPGIPHDGQLIYPAFLFDIAANREAAEIVGIFRDAGWDDGDIVLWLGSPNGYLDGNVPADLLATGAVESVARLLAEGSW